jgi:hypothetical protein
MIVGSMNSPISGVDGEITMILRAMIFIIGFNIGMLAFLANVRADPLRWSTITHTSKAVIVEHPIGCPWKAFCGCGAALRIFGHHVRSLWRASEWFKFPRTSPSPGMVAVRRHHVFVLEQHLGGDRWLAYDANSGGHRTRIHARSIAGYVIVDPYKPVT